MVGIRGKVREEAQTIVKHATQHHGIRFKELKFSRPLRIGNLVLFEFLLGFLLTLCQFAPLKDIQHVVVFSFGSAWIVVFQRNQQ